MGDPVTFELFRVRLPLIEPFVASHGAETERDVVLVAVSDGDHRGWGECSALSAPTYTSECAETAWCMLRDEVGPALARNRGAWVRPDACGPMVTAAVEGALADLRARSGDAPRPPLDRDRVPCCRVVGRQPTIDRLLAVVDAEMALGYRSFKLKIGPSWDSEPLGAVRRAWPDVSLSADANGSYTAADVGNFKALTEFGLGYIEQPLPPGDDAAVAELRRRLGLRVALDESIMGLNDLRRAIAGSAIDVVNCKPARLGGALESAAVAALARASGLSAFVGGMLETGVGRSHALVAASSDDFDLPTDLGPSSRYFVADITAPIELVAPGVLPVPGGPGLSIDPVPTLLEAFTVDRVVFEAQ